MTGARKIFKGDPDQKPIADSGKYVNSPFTKPNITRFSIGQLATLTIDELDCKEFRYRAINSNILKHVGEHKLETLADF